MLKIERVTRRFGSKVAVEDVDLEIPAGQMVGIIGRSGAGKSTLLRMINRLIDVSDGRISFDGMVVSSLRGYFRWRASLGDRTHALVGALAYPANWQLASLPKSLEPAEVEQLEAALGQSGPSMLRADAIVRCALDLGLRSGEVARLSLDDIDWDAGTITLRRTKGRREDVMPLPEATGQAIAAYLRSERPKTQHRMIFARHMTPRERPIGPDLVRKTIRQAYARAGLPHTRSHLLRHTMASRLLAGGSSLKEVADVLRHRSLNTTLIYAKLDSGRLVEVALPWPGTSTAAAGRLV